ncbi:glycoside hydrolase family 2 TIM barrel-domain containing protein [Aestuariibaculum sp. YM273]|uniref:glycoside hydrolase family 2 protein n=1 Tax=Aestuariibaculum sp. YM273 TaxID=3070659 RepID=UPI0027DD8D06|nr:glycoside hydrolase family 2 TIM barrel-domain containing protein [Aestuariibaculum sp. YM273]WMI66770.1 glycoside hydrolase family 2 TIM barrel-domain containing protein [Aestuariibaculum sp. YM273]
MNLKNISFAFFLVVLITFKGMSQNTEIVYLSGTDADHTVDWDFYCTEGRNSGVWTTIPVPSNWELQGFGNYNYGHDWANKKQKLGKEHGLYKHQFEVPNSWKGKTINIVFDGSMTDTKVKINGKSAGDMHQGGFYRFKYDVSKLLKFGQTNVLEVDVAKHSENESINRAERQADFWIFGGIFRPVFLEVLPETHMSRVAIDPKMDGTFNVFVNLNNSKSNYSSSIELFDLKGNKIGETVNSEINKGNSEAWISGQFEGVKAWNPEFPTLYNMKVSLKKGNKVLHEVTERIGFRTVELREHDGFYINNEKVVFKGANRHSFWPETGRVLSDKHHIMDIELMKEMNMNAVRSSHYPPDERFLSLCDSLGLFVLDEVTGWQQGYDTVVGPKLVKETILKDENHASVVIWDHGNEGGWDFKNEDGFNLFDIQKRPVIYPWLLRNGVDTHHYPEFEYAIGRNIFGNNPFMPTEFLHGLYDGGHGAGLEDYWRNYQTSPLHAGGFLWSLVDEAVLRTDKPGTVFDGDGNHAPDGILGPHREREGSFYTIKEIWSPVQVEPVSIIKSWNGRIFLTNKFIYTNLNQCEFKWEAVKTGLTPEAETIIASGNATSPDAKPGETAQITIDHNNALQNADLFRFTAVDPHGRVLYTWSWPVIQPKDKAKELLQKLNGERNQIVINETETSVVASVSKLKIEFSKTNGELLSIENEKGNVSFTGGPSIAGVKSEILGTNWKTDKEGNFSFEINSKGYPRKMTWTLLQSGLLKFEANPLREHVTDIDFIGISFNYPEEQCTGVTWMGKGPYRVWKNRLKGSNIGVWKKAYNNTITGESFENLIYPEFKGYHGTLFWATLETKESPITIISETPNLYFQLFKPAKPKHIAGGTDPSFPDGDISFLYEIPAIGTKFFNVDHLGPTSKKGMFFERHGDDSYPIKLWFDFRNSN